MMQSKNKKEAMKSYITAADLLPERLWWGAFSITEGMRLQTEEFRLRVGQPMELTVAGRACPIRSGEGALPVAPEDIEAVLAKASRCSLHSREDELRQGYLTAAGGHRIGLCGRMTRNEGGAMVAEPSALNIRIARQIIGLGDRLLEALDGEAGFESTLLLAPPGVGKTTLLRDLCRGLSQKYRVSVADSRFELCGSLSGAARFDLGRCDVMQGGEKSAVIPMLLRAMSPEILALDEITAAADLEAVCAGSYTGCAFLATAHGSRLDDLHKRPLYRQMMDMGIFRRVVLLERRQQVRTCRIYERRIQDDKNHWIDHDRHFLLDDGDLPERRSAPPEPGAEGPYHGAAADPHGDPL